MKPISWVYLVGLLIVMGGCASQSTTPQEEAPVDFTPEDTGKDVVLHSTFGSADIRSWRVVDDSAIIIDTSRYGELIATFMRPCRGIRYTEVIGFDTMGPFDLDRTTKVILPDGTACHFKTLKRYIKLDDGESEPEADD